MSSTGNEAVTRDECSEKNAASMQWGKETADAVTAELQKVADITERLNLSVEKQSWIISDPDMGLISQTKQLALVVNGLKEKQANYELRMNNYEKINAQAIEARKPWQSLAMDILKQVIWTALVIFSAIMWEMYRLTQLKK